jgi:hypothetical protein
MEQRHWAIDESEATVTFVATSSVHPIRSSGTASGWLEATLDDESFDADGTLRGRLEIPLADLSSGNPLIDREMKRRLATRAHPLIVAEIESTEEVSQSSATVTGTIRFLDLETLVEGQLNVGPGPRLTGVGEFDVRWWGLEPPRLLMLRVDPIVTVEIDLPLV